MEAVRGAELVSAAVEVTGGADLVAADVVINDVGLIATAASPRCLLVHSA